MTRNEARLQLTRRLNRIQDRSNTVNKKFASEQDPDRKVDLLEEYGFLQYERAVVMEEIQAMTKTSSLPVRIYRAIRNK